MRHMLSQWSTATLRCLVVLGCCLLLISAFQVASRMALATTTSQPAEGAGLEDPLVDEAASEGETANEGETVDDGGETGPSEDETSQPADGESIVPERLVMVVSDKQEKAYYEVLGPISRNPSNPDEQVDFEGGVVGPALFGQGESLLQNADPSQLVAQVAESSSDETMDSDAHGDLENPGDSTTRDLVNANADRAQTEVDEVADGGVGIEEADSQAGLDVSGVSVQDPSAVFDRGLVWVAPESGTRRIEGPGDLVFDWGQCSDVLVWASVMLLYEQGLVGFDTPISQYLPEGIELPSGYSSITLTDLMNHTTGIDAEATAAPSAKSDGRTILDVLERFVPHPATASGTVVAYSSYDVALACAVVEGVSETDICTFITSNILEPMGMDDTAVATVVTSAEMVSSADERTASIATRLYSKDTAGYHFDIVNGFSIDEELVSYARGGAAVTCIGTLSDLARLGEAIVYPAESGGLFSDSSTCSTLFRTSQSYPGLGTRRIAHGLFALPLYDVAVGAVGGQRGVTCALFASFEDQRVVAAVVPSRDQSEFVMGSVGYAFYDLAWSEPAEDQVGDDGIPEVPEESGAIPLPSAASARILTTDFGGVYRDEGMPTHGAAKLLTTLSQTRVDVSGDGPLVSIDGVKATRLGRGAYVAGTSVGEDPYRFHVSLARGMGYSRMTSDASRVSSTTLTLETFLLAIGGVGLLVSAIYFVGALAAVVRTRARGGIWGGQTTCVVLSGMTIACAIWTTALLLGSGAFFLSVVPTLRVLNAIYAVVAVSCLIWLGVTRWRGVAKTPGKLVVVFLVGTAAIALMLNLAYWEMLP